MSSPSFRQQASNVFKLLTQNWRPLLLTDLSFKALGVLLFAPTVAFSFRTLLAFSGREVLADEDIAEFMLGPAGLITLVAVATLAVGIVALEQTTLLAVLAESASNNSPSVVSSLSFAASKLPTVLRLTGRMVTLGLLWAAPFLTIAGITYWFLLTDFDINYYLAHRPPKFIAAIVIGAILGICLTLVMLRLASSWLFSLPIAIFENASPKEAISTSQQRSNGNKLGIVIWIATWFLVGSISTSLLSSAVLLVGRTVVPQMSATLWLLALGIGLFSSLIFLLQMLCSVLSTTSFAAILFETYHDWGAEGRRREDDSKHVAQASGSLRITRTQLLGILVVGGIAAVVIGYNAIDSIAPEDDVQITAHRGASADAPENTMAAFRKAIDDRTDWIELDVQEDANGEVIVAHDSDFKRIAGNPLKVWDSNLTLLADVDIGSSFSPEFASERVPTLKQVLEECKGKAKVNIELKYYGHDVALEEKVINIVEDQEMEDDIVIMSLSLPGLQKVKSMRPNWTCGLLTAVKVGDLTRIQAADFFAVNGNLATRKFIRAVHQNDKKVYAWTINDASLMSEMIGRGVDNIITDRPGLAKSVIQQRAELGGPERLALGLSELFGVQHKVFDQ